MLNMPLPSENETPKRFTWLYSDQLSTEKETREAMEKALRSSPGRKLALVEVKSVMELTLKETPVGQL